MQSKHINFSVLMTTYYGEAAQNLDDSLNSILVNQTVLPNQVVLVLDGAMREDCEAVIRSYKQRFPEILEIVPCQINQGQSKASEFGLRYVKYDYVARMDSDDISVFNRFEREIEKVIEHPECDVVGGWIEEFVSVPGDLSRVRTVPEKDSDIKSAFHNRTPINNVTAMIRKQAIIDAGGYGRDTVNEDYSLYAHMWVSGCTFYNLPEIMVYVRVGNGMIARRRDWRIFRDWCKDQVYLYRNRKQKLITSLASCTKCFIFIAVPERVKNFLYRHYLRITKK